VSSRRRSGGSTTSIRDETDPERDENLAWALKDTRGRLFDPEYFHLDDINNRLFHVLEDTPEAAVALDDLAVTIKVGRRRPG